jgi:hypothetical protein
MRFKNFINFNGDCWLKPGGIFCDCAHSCGKALLFSLGENWKCGYQPRLRQGGFILKND